MRCLPARARWRRDRHRAAMARARNTVDMLQAVSWLRGAMTKRLLAAVKERLTRRLVVSLQWFASSSAS